MPNRRENAALDPATALFLRLPAPPLPPRKLRAILPSLLSAELPFPAGDCVARFGRRRPDGTVEAHVVRRSDLSALLSRLAGAGQAPSMVLPPGPVLWRWALSMQPLPPDTPRAVVFAPGQEAGGAASGAWCVVAAGHGELADSISAFRPDPSHAGDGPTRRLRLAFRGLPHGLRVLAVGGGAHAIAAELKAAGVSVAVPDSPETALARALAAPGLDDLDFRVGEFADPASARSASLPLLCTSLAFLVAAAAWAAAADSSARRAEAERRAAVAERAAAFERLAGRRLATRGAAALAEAREEAAARRDAAVAAPDCAGLLPAALDAARASGVALSRVSIEDAALSAAGTAPDETAAAAFVAEAVSRGLRTSLSEAPRPDGHGRLAFFVHPGGAGSGRSGAESGGRAAP